MQARDKEATMSDTCGPTFEMPSMRYDLVSSSWRTCEASSLWDLEMSSPTFPEWGMTLSGVLYELPTPAHPTPGPACSSLPTPQASDAKGTNSLTVALSRIGIRQMYLSEWVALYEAGLTDGLELSDDLVLL
jgi:hypothetical protein